MAKKPAKKKVAAKKPKLAAKKPKLAAKKKLSVGALSAKDQARINCKHVLEALHAETGGMGGDVAAARVQAYCNDPINATATEFAFVGSLILRRWYIDPAKPNAAERASLWQEVRTRMQRSLSPVPSGWGGDSEVFLVQAMAEETP
jgi:hypothetical protein